MSKSQDFLNAIKQNQIDKVKKMLMDKKYDFACTDAQDHDSLSLAFYYKRVNIAKLLLEYGAPVDTSDTLANSLHHAILLNDPILVNTVIKKGVDPNKCYDGNFSLFEAFYSSKDVIITLLDNGANVNINNVSGENFLHMMVSRGEMIAIERLLNSDIDKNKINNRGLTPIMVAIYENKYDLAKYLYKKGCTVITTDKKNCLTMSIQNKNIEMTNFFLKKGAPVNKLDSDGVTPILEAVKSNDLNFVKVLIKKGANPNLFGPDQNSPLYEAINHKNVEMIQFLLDKGANPKKKEKDGKSSIDLAYEVGEPKIEDIFDELFPSKFNELKNLMCFDEKQNKKFSIRKYINSKENIIIKNNKEFKGYNRDNILKHLNEKGTLYSNEKINKDYFEHLIDTNIHFFELFNTGFDESILVPYSDEAFVNKLKPKV